MLSMIRQGSKAGAAWLRGGVARIFRRKLLVTDPSPLFALFKKKSPNGRFPLGDILIQTDSFQVVSAGETFFGMINTAALSCTGNSDLPVFFVIAIEKDKCPLSNACL